MELLMPGFDSARAIFCTIAWSATLLAALVFVISFFTDFDGGDADVASGTDAGMFSFRAVLGFFLGFGWVGYICQQLTGNVMWASGAGVAAGLLMFVLVAMLIRMIYGLRSDGNISPASLVGLSGTVYVSIPPKGEPGGQVQVAHPNQLITIAAVQQGDEVLPAGSRIVVIDSTVGLVMVKPLS
ncbi:MAG: hypothetical protein J6R92_02845 [Akkermansia sp.]|nr:hypothetical protein [Akkermansia sp.]